MRQIAFLLVAVAMAAGIVAYVAPASGQTDGQAALIFVTKIPPGYRDFRLISVAHEEGNLNSLGAVLGNDVAIKAYREGTLPYPDGTIIAALHYRHAPSEENNRIFGQAQSFVPGAPTNIQFMVKDSTKVCRDGRLGVRSLRHGRQTECRGRDEDLLSLPRAGKSSRPCLHQLRTVIARAKHSHVLHRL